MEAIKEMIAEVVVEPTQLRQLGPLIIEEQYNERRNKCTNLSTPVSNNGVGLLRPWPPLLHLAPVVLKDVICSAHPHNEEKKSTVATSRVSVI